MKKIILLIGLLGASAIFSFAQKPKSPAPKIVKKTPPVAAVVVKAAAAAISDADWKTLVDALAAENWDASASLAARLLARLKTENEKKQMARLRYFYLYALAGKIFKLAASKNAAAQEILAWDEIKRASAQFFGKEFVLPPRRFSADCPPAALNFVCAVKNNEKAVRTVAINRTGTEIHSFDYVLFDEKIAYENFKDNKIFLGGVLRKTEFNEDLSKPWVMRLIFAKGFAQVAFGE